MNLIWATALRAAVVIAQSGNDSLGLGNGFTSFNLPGYSVKLVKDSQTLSSLRPHELEDFDFLPSEYLEQRAANGQYQTGDLLFRYRTIDSSEWLAFDTAQSRKPVRPLGTNDTALAKASLQPTLGDSHLDVSRTWAEQDGDLTLKFSLTNRGNSTIILGGLGFPITSDNIFTDRTAVDINAHDSFTDPYIGLDAGYVQITRVNGMGPSMLVTPINHDSAFEAWDFLHEDSVDSDELGYETPNFEGFYQWMTHTLAYAEQEWNSSIPWNPPSSREVKPGDTLTVGVRFTLVDEISKIEQAVQDLGMPLARSLPGYIIPSDLEAKLYLYNAEDVGPLSTEPADAFDIKYESEGQYTLTPAEGVFGRVSVMIPLPKGRLQTVQYHISHPGPVAVQEAGQFLNDRHWWTEESDAFGRGPAFMAVDHTDGIGQPIIQDYLARVWLSGETHEAGASWYTAALKQIAQPDAEQVDKLEEFVEKVMWKTIQHPNYTVPQSVFWYNPNLTDYEYNPAYPWEPDVPDHYSVSWNIDRAKVTTRSYGYVYPVSAYWALYRVGRTHPSMLKRQDWEWYLSQAYETVAYCFKKENGTHLQPLWNVGLMGENAFGELLKDLYREGWTNEATHMESLMKERSGNWSMTAIPFGSELGWDCTGEEGVYYWSQYFGDTATVEKTIRTIQGYDPLIAHWGYNGNARRYWDFQFDGKYDRMERQIHHYGSALNALPLLQHIRTRPADSTQHMLRLAFGGHFAPISNIHEDGFASAAMHSWADMLSWDEYSGDYGLAFAGLVLGAACYVMEDEEFGLTAYYGTLSTHDESYTVYPRDALRRRMYIGPVDAFFEFDAGVIACVTVTGESIAMELRASATDSAAPAEEAVLWINQTFYVGDAEDEDLLVGGHDIERRRGGWAIPFRNGEAVIHITRRGNEGLYR